MRVCGTHGGSSPQAIAAAERREQERQAIAAANGAGLDLAGFDGDPYAAIDDALARAHQLVVRLGGLVDGIEDGSLRYQGKIGEQVRGELTIYQRALHDLVVMAERKLRLDLDDRRVRIARRQGDQFVRALDRILVALGVRDDPRVPIVVPRELRALMAEDGGGAA